MYKLIGLALLLGGVYFLGKDIIFSTYYSPYFWRSVPAMGSVLAIVAGVVSLVWFPRKAGNFGWACLILGIVLVFLSGGVSLRPTSLWSLFIGLAAILSGYRLLTSRESRF
jgi:hypothetical protein